MQVKDTDLTAEQILQRIAQLRHELDSRFGSEDVFKSIKGQEHAKRAIVVAAVQSHTVALIGPHGCGKHMLARAARTVGVPTHIFHPCPCGNYTNPRLPCECQSHRIKQHHRRISPTLRLCHIHVEVPPVPACELLSARHGTTTRQAKDQLTRAGNPQDILTCTLDDASLHILRQATSELGLSAHAVATVLAVAASIAALANQPRITVDGIVEAIHYRPLVRIFGA